MLRGWARKVDVVFNLFDRRDQIMHPEASEPTDRLLFPQREFR